MFKLSIGFEPRLPCIWLSNPFMSFFQLFINKLSNLSPSLFRKNPRLYVCGWEELFKMPPILRWSSFAPLDEEAASQLNFTSEIEYTEKKIYKTKKCQLWNPSRDCLSLARAFHLLFLPLGNKMTLLAKQQKHWVVRWWTTIREISGDAFFQE